MIYRAHEVTLFCDCHEKPTTHDHRPDNGVAKFSAGSVALALEAARRSGWLVLPNERTICPGCATVTRAGSSGESGGTSNG